MGNRLRFIYRGRPRVVCVFAARITRTYDLILWMGTQNGVWICLCVCVCCGFWSTFYDSQPHSEDTKAHTIYKYIGYSCVSPRENANALWLMMMVSMAYYVPSRWNDEWIRCSAADLKCAHKLVSSDGDNSIRTVFGNSQFQLPFAIA